MNDDYCSIIRLLDEDEISTIIDSGTIEDNVTLSKQDDKFHDKLGKLIWSAKLYEYHMCSNAVKNAEVKIYVNGFSDSLYRYSVCQFWSLLCNWNY